MLAAYRSGDQRATTWLGASADTDPVRFATSFLSHGSWDREALTRILGQATRGSASAATLSAISSLRSPSAVCVVAGQQPAVGGGPLYTLVKAAQAIAAA